MKAKSKMNTANTLGEQLETANNVINNSPEEALEIYFKVRAFAAKTHEKFSESKAVMGIADYHFRKEDFDKADKFCLEALEIMKKNSLKNESWKYCNQYANRYFKYGDFKRSLYFFNISLSMVRELNDQKHLAGILGNVSYMQIKLGKFSDAENNILESIEIQRSLQNFHGLARAQNQLAELYHRKGNMEKTLECYIDAMSYLKKVKNDSSREQKILLAIISNNIANIYKDLSDFPKALDFYKVSLKMKEELNEESRIAVTLCNIGIVYKNLKEYDISFEYFSKGLNLCKKLNLRTEESNIYLNLGNLYYEKGNLADTLKYYMKSEKLRRTFDDPYVLVNILKNIANVLIELKETENAEKYLDESLKLSQKYGFLEAERDIYRTYIELLSKDKNDSIICNYMKKFTVLNEKLIHEKYSASLAEMKTKFESELKEKEAEILREQNIELESKNKQIEMQKEKLEITLEELRRSEINYTFASEELKKSLDSTIVGESEPIKKIINLISKVTKTTATTILITGESGTGKELIARAIHDFSDRKKGNFCAVNVSSIQETLFESEFFGHKKNAFTGAKSDKVGWFEIANGGTLFLDEIGTLQENLQVKILRVLEERKIVRVGSTKEIPIDVRIVSATNSDLLSAVNDKSFRTDLYHRLSTFVINIPPLRERISDIPLLLEHFVKFFSKQMNKKITKVERKAEALLLSYNFPGNVRELKNLIERAIIVSNSSTLKASHFNIPKNGNNIDCNNKIIPLEKLERQMVIKALKATGFHQARAAKLLGIKPKTIERRMIKYGIKKS